MICVNGLNLPRYASAMQAPSREACDYLVHSKSSRVHREDRLPGRIPHTGYCRQNLGEWLSLVEHLVRDQGVGGSNPLSPTI